MYKVLKKMSHALPLTFAVVGASTVSAAAAANLSFLNTAVSQISGIIAVLIPLLVALGVLFFIWGLVQFIFASGDEAAKDEGKRKMIWGVVALFIIVSVWGLVALLNQLTGVKQGEGFAPVNVTPAP